MIIHQKTKANGPRTRSTFNQTHRVGAQDAAKSAAMSRSGETRRNTAHISTAKQISSGPQGNAHIADEMIEVSSCAAFLKRSPPVPQSSYLQSIDPAARKTSNISSGVSLFQPLVC
jgi:hypothetical protein